MTAFKEYIYTDDCFTFEGAVSVQCEKDFFAPWRIKFDKLELFPFLNIKTQGMAPSGVRLCFTSNTKYVKISLHETFPNQKFDFYADDQLVEEVLLDESTKQYMFKKLPEGMKNITIWLTLGVPCMIKNISVEEGSVIRKTYVNQKRWVHYGSSISHSVRAKTPSTSWPALVSRFKNLHLTNLGFGGNCILDPMMGKVIRDLPADIITLKLGINCVDGRLSDRSFEPCAIGLIETIREKHLLTPIVVISPIINPPRETKKGISNLCLMDMRIILCQMVEKFKKYHDENIYYVNGLDIFGEEHLCYMQDQLHPDAEGQLPLALNFIEKVLNKFI